MIVTLNEAEMRVACAAGCDRRLGAIANQSVEVHGKMSRGDYWSADIEAVGAEIAVAKALGRYWGPAASAAEDRAQGDLLDGIQIRSTQYKTGRLIVHHRDDDDHRFILVVGTMPQLYVAGWMYGLEAKSERYWDTTVPRPAFFVPQSALQPISTLLLV